MTIRNSASMKTPTEQCKEASIMGHQWRARQVTSAMKWKGSSAHIEVVIQMATNPAFFSAVTGNRQGSYHLLPYIL